MIETLLNLQRAAGHEPPPIPERRSTLASPSPWLTEALGGVSNSYAGEVVTPNSALAFIDVQSCVRILAETHACFPLHVFRRGGGSSREFARDNYLYPLLHDSPNDEMTAFDFWQATVNNQARWGNAYTWLDWNNANRLRAMYPMRPDWMTVERDSAGKLVYKYRPGAGEREGDYSPDEILHFRGMSGDGLVGYSPITLARHAIGLGMSAEKTGAKFFANGAKMSGILTVPGKLRDPEAEANKFDERHAGAMKAGRTLVLGDGSKYVTTTMPFDDAQFLETRQFQRSEIAGMYRIPPHLLGDTEKSTSWGTGIAQMSVGFVKFTMLPWARNHECALNHKLFKGTDYFCEFEMEALQRGDLETRVRAYKDMILSAQLAPNEARAYENNPPMPGGDELIMQSQYIPLRKLGQVAPEGI